MNKISPTTTLVLGLFFTLPGLGLLLFLAPQTGGLAAKYASLARCDGSAWRTLAAGTECLANARISAKNRALTQDLVAYVVESYSPGVGSSKPTWSVTNTHRPPLTLDIEGVGEAQLTGAYEMFNAPKIYGVEDNVRHRGLAAGEAVAIHGVLGVADAQDRRTLDGRIIAAGSVQQFFIDDQKLGHQIAIWLGLGLLTAGLILLAAWVRMRRRR